MPDLGNVFRGTVSGAATGNIFGPYGAIVGGAVGALTGLLTPSEEKKRRARIEGLRRLMEEIKQQNIARAEEQRQKGLREIRELAQDLRQNEAARAERLARSLGREGEALSYALPATTAVANQATSAMRQYNLGVDEQIQRILENYDRERLGLEYDVASEPFEPDALDYLDVLGGAATTYTSVRDALRAQSPIDFSHLRYPVSVRQYRPPMPKTYKDVIQKGRQTAWDIMPGRRR